MANIKPNTGILTLINTFDVDPDKCDALLTNLIDATKNAMHDVDGFLSASFHKSRDGKHVANYAQ